MASKRKKTKSKAKKRAVPASVHANRFPGESAGYRLARDKLLRAEVELRRHIEDVAVLRRKLPAGGVVPEEYVFETGGVDLDDRYTTQPVMLSELFDPGKDILVIYNFMYGPDMERPCPMCTAMLDGLNGNAPHIAQRVNLAVVAKSPIDRILTFARERGWRNLRLLSSADNSYNCDYHGETADGAQMPMLNVFVQRDSEVHHFYGTELLFAPADPGQNPRHVDLLWPLWQLFDLTPEGRGTNWYPALHYP